MLTCPGAFGDFLSSFKESASTSEKAATDALDALNLEEHDSDYDFMDDADEQDGQRRTRRSQARSPKKKYMDVLQDVADRKRQDICIELDDLAIVCDTSCDYHSANIAI